MNKIAVIPPELLIVYRQLLAINIQMSVNFSASTVIDRRFNYRVNKFHKQNDSV